MQKSKITNLFFVAVLFCAGSVSAKSLNMAHVVIEQDYIKPVKIMQKDFKKRLAQKSGKDKVKEEIQTMFELDQFTRWFLNEKQERLQLQAHIDDFDRRMGKRLRKMDREHTDRLKRIIKKHGWPDIARFGKTIEYQAWLLVQHADHDLEFQKEVLQTLESLVPDNLTQPKNFAYLFDRVAVNEKNLQRFGTQGLCVAKNDWRPRLIRDPKTVDQRRKAVGLKSLKSYMEKNSKLFCH